MTRAEKARVYYIRNRERIREQQSRYAASKRESKKKQNDQYRRENKEQIKNRRSLYERSEKSRLRKKEYYRSNLNRFLLSNAKARARRLSLPFNLELSDISIPKICPILRIPIVHGNLRTYGSPSVDRKVPCLGYVKGNIQIISWRANNLKSDATLKELIALGKWATRET